MRCSAFPPYLRTAWVFFFFFFITKTISPLMGLPREKGQRPWNSRHSVKLKAQFNLLKNLYNPVQSGPDPTHTAKTQKLPFFFKGNSRLSLGSPYHITAVSCSLHSYAQHYVKEISYESCINLCSTFTSHTYVLNTYLILFSKLTPSLGNFMLGFHEYY